MSADTREPSSRCGNCDGFGTPIQVIDRGDALVTVYECAACGTRWREKR